ncbi:MAG: DNA-processing protein DprA [Patescibacteria group bacterium]|nr:DNA-processing protein DprA [Patescibacteria group bacterium]
MENKEAVFYNALNVLKSANYRELKKLKEKYGSWEKAWHLLGEEKNRINPEKERQKLEKSGVKLILEKDKNYPPLLKEISQPPLGIYFMGAPIPQEKQGLAVVGTRKASSFGKEIAYNFSFNLANSGLIIVSGLALGIDASAHEGALKADAQTIAVLGNGLGNFYPKQNEQLANKILKSGGTIVSEYPLEMPSLPHQFLPFFLGISGLSRGVLVVEAPRVSGALGTAAHAIHQNRDVFVVPGAINNSNYEGSHDLIRQGAELVTKPENILKSLGIEVESQKQKTVALSEEEKQILGILNKAGRPVSADRILELAGNLDIVKMNKILTLLVIKSVILENQGTYTPKN